MMYDILGVLRKKKDKRKHVLKKYVAVAALQNISFAPVRPAAASARPLWSKLFLRILFKRLLPTLLVLLLALGALLWLLNVHNAEGIRPAAGAAVYVYEGDGEILVKTLRIENHSVREYLLQISGFPEYPFNGTIVRAEERSESNIEYSFYVNIDGQSRLIFQLSYGEGVVFQPKEDRSFWVNFKESSKDWTFVQELLDDWNRQQKAAGYVAK